MLWELNHTEKGAGRALAKAKTLNEAVDVATRQYLRPDPKVIEQEVAQRSGIADRLSIDAQTQLAGVNRNVVAAGGGQNATLPQILDRRPRVAANDGNYIVAAGGGSR